MTANSGLPQAWLDAIGALVVVVDADGRIVGFNRACAQATGCGLEGVKGRLPCEVLAVPEEAERIRGIFQKVLAGQSPQSIETHWLTRPDSRRPITWSLSAVVDAGGAVRHVVATGIDVMEQWHVKHRLELERLVATISARFIDLGPDELDRGITYALEAIGEFAGVDRSYVFMASADGRLMDNTHEWCAAGIEPQIQNLQGLPAAAFPWWMDTLRRFETIRIPRVADLPAEASAERDLLAGQGIQSLVAVPLISAGRVIGFLGFDSVRVEKTWAEEDFALLRTLADVFVHVLERKRAEESRRWLEEQLRQAQKIEAVGRLAGGIAHDFNNLLTIIKGYGSLLWDRLKKDRALRADVEKMQEAAERAERLTRQLLAFSRHRPAQPKVFEINPLIGDLAKMLRRLIGEDTELRLVLDPAAGSVNADPNRLEQTLLNLVVNARDAMPAGGKLTIETANANVDELPDGRPGDAPPGRYVTFSVSDTGGGMPEEVRAHIFEPFFTTKEPGHGTGLGLATVYGTVKQAGGHICVESEVGHGSTFRIYLPRVEMDLAPAPAPPPAKGSLRGTETILLVEDERPVRSLIRTALRPFGYKVVEANDGAEALRLCQEHGGPIHLLLTDVVMPHMDGPELARRVALLHPETKVLYISGYPDPAVASRGAPDLRSELLEKPFTPDDLRRKVRQVLDEAGRPA